MRLIKQIEFAKECGVSAPVVNRAVKRSGLGVAMEGKLLDADHPAAVAFKKTRVGKQPPPPPVSPHLPPPPPSQPNARPPALDDMAALMDLPLREIIYRYSSMQGFDQYLKAVKAMEDITEKSLKNEERKGNLIPRDFVERVMLGLLEELFVRLLSDAPRTINARITEAVAADIPQEDREKEIRDLISTQLKATKKKILGSLSDV